MMKVCFVRGKYLNNFEGQNYLFNSPNTIQLTAVSSLFPLHRHFPFPVRRLLSPIDFSFFGREIKYFGNRLLGDSQILFGLEKFADKFDIFHTADPHYYYSYQLAKFRKRNLVKKLIVTSWETIPFNNETVERKRFIKYFTLKQADHFICYTVKAKNSLVREGVKDTDISVIKLGVNLDRFRFKIDKNARSRKFVKDGKITILFVGRLTEEKGILDLYEMFKTVKRETESESVKRLNMRRFLHLKIVGEGKIKKALIKLARNDGLQEFVSIEHKSYEQMPEIYQDSDIFVLASKTTKTWEEQYGMVLVEAMASGLPIVAYDTGAISEVIGTAGILVKEGDKNDLTISIKHLIENKKLRSKLGKMGRKRAEKEFDAKKTAKKIASIYKNVTVNS